MNQQIFDILAKQYVAITADEMGMLITYFSEHHVADVPADWVSGILRTVSVMQGQAEFDDSVGFRKNSYKKFDHHFTTNYRLKADIVKQV